MPGVGGDRLGARMGDGDLEFQPFAEDRLVLVVPAIDRDLRFDQSSFVYLESGFVGSSSEPTSSTGRRSTRVAPRGTTTDSTSTWSLAFEETSLKHATTCLLVLPLLALLTIGCADPAAHAANEAAATAVADTAQASLAGAAGATAERTFELTYRAVLEEIPEGADTVRVWLPYPGDDENQDVEVTEISSPVPWEVRREPEFGNRVLYLEIGDPGETLEVVMKARVRREEVLRKELHLAKDQGDPEADSAIAKWLEPDNLVPVHDERIQRLAEEVTADAETDLQKIRAIYDYVVETMTYSKEGTGWGRGDIYWACDAKTGNCTDFHALFTGLARASGIPAKFAIGFPVPADRGEGRIGGYHCWSEFHLEGYGWVPVDASEAAKDPAKKEYYFGGHDENRVEFSEGRDLVLDPEQEADPLNYFVYPHVEVDGRPHEAVVLDLSYRDVGPVAAPLAAP